MLSENPIASEGKIHAATQQNTPKIPNVDNPGKMIFILYCYHYDFFEFDRNDSEIDNQVCIILIASIIPAGLITLTITPR